MGKRGKSPRQSQEVSGEKAAIRGKRKLKANGRKNEKNAKKNNGRKPMDLRPFKVAGWTRLELATSCVTDRVILYNYQFIRKLCWKVVECPSSKHMLFYLSINLANYLLIASKKSIFYSSFSV